MVRQGYILMAFLVTVRTLRVELELLKRRTLAL